MKIKLNQPMKCYEAGRTLVIQTDADGLPLEKFWRRRIKDAEIDNCVEVIKSSKPKQLLCIMATQDQT